MRLSLILVLVMAGTWSLVIGEFSLRQILLGLVFGTVFVLVTRAGRGRSVPVSHLPRRMFYVSLYLFVLLPYDIARSNVDMARRLLHRRPVLRPGIMRLRLGPASEATSALVAHAATMMPGVMVVDMSEDHRTFYIHIIDIREAEERQASFLRIYHTVLRRVFR
jgi:multicomponent Na+:H+ antiporter subunit E